MLCFFDSANGVTFGAKLFQQYMLTRKEFLSFLVAVFLISACNSNKTKEEKPNSEAIDVVGTWKAQWVTDPASYPDVDPSVKFTMDGQFEFKPGGQVTISAYGHKGCIFSSDTLVHSLYWKLRNDTLKLVNENDIHGMTYSVLALSSEKMKLQLMDDIFLNLNKK